MQVSISNTFESSDVDRVAQQALSLSSASIQRKVTSTIYNQSNDEGCLKNLPMVEKNTSVININAKLTQKFN